ncbi:Putative ubiquinone biosynthesis monooxygenase [Malassezia yamatoensis]|uniref:Ubiquinone biosynthesis monooxygenase n=1 Tax=Malassezia yamatoensis TaxID=253288 RepID=A0AAJ5YVE1_9BASI|nr:Putative ubiquinone biosynthesis monooxygenase [Malassezia yamatoensis]
MAHTSSTTDIVIVGGGVVGLAMLAGLVSNRSLPAMKVALVDTMNLSNLASWKINKEKSTRPATPRHDGIQWENRVISMNTDNLAWMQRRYLQLTLKKLVQKPI